MENTEQRFNVNNLTENQVVIVNDDRFTPPNMENHKQGTFRKFSNDRTKIMLTIGGKIVWLPASSFVSLGKPYKSTEVQTPTEAPTEAVENAPEPVVTEEQPAVMHDIVEPGGTNATPNGEEIIIGQTTEGPIVANDTPEESPLEAEPLNAVKEKIIGWLQKTLRGTATDIAAGIGRAETALKSNLNNLFKKGFLTYENDVYALTEYGSTYTPASVTEEKPKRAEYKRSGNVPPIDQIRERSAKMYQMWDEGKTDKEIAEALDCPLSSVRVTKTSYLIKKTEKEGKKVLFTGKKDSVRYKIIELRDAGKTDKEIAELVECDRSYISATRHLTLQA